MPLLNVIFNFTKHKIGGIVKSKITKIASIALCSIITLASFNLQVAKASENVFINEKTAMSEIEQISNFLNQAIDESPVYRGFGTGIVRDENDNITKINITLENINDTALIHDILSLTNIPEENIAFTEINVENAFGGMFGLPSFTLEELGLEEKNMDSNQSSSDAEQRVVFRLGDLVLTPDPSSPGYYLYMSVGSPLSSRLGFNTANHGAIKSGASVLSGSGIVVGSIGQTSFGGRTDVSEVRINSNDGIGSGNTINTTLPDTGQNLTNFKAPTPSVGTSVKAYLGYSNTVRTGQILSTSESFVFDGVPMNDIIIVSMNAQGGDSGSVLVNGTGAIGLLTIGGLSYGGTPAVAFTKTTNIPWN